MAHDLTRREAIGAAAGLFALPVVAAAEKPDAAPADAITLVVTDPLCADLACSCVEGYAQRDYAKLGKYLEAKVGKPVAVHSSESLAGALAKKTGGKADLIIGKDSVTRAHAAASKLTVTRLLALTGKDGKTTQTGLVCVAGADKALTVNDLKGYTIYFGSEAAEEKHAAALELFKDLGAEVPAKPTTCPTCTDGAKKVVEGFKAGEKVATVISSYAKPLLEGCGTVKKGELRVVGETDPVPFVAVFATASLSLALRDAVVAALLEVGKHPQLCAALETKAGFVKPDDGAKKK